MLSAVCFISVMFRGITISPSAPGLAVNTKGLMELVLTLTGPKVELTNTAGARVIGDTEIGAGVGVENTNIGLGLVLVGVGALTPCLTGISSNLSCPNFGDFGGGLLGLGGLAPLTTLTGLLLNRLLLLPSDDCLNSSNPGTVGGLL